MPSNEVELELPDRPNTYIVVARAKVGVRDVLEEWFVVECRVHVAREVDPRVSEVVLLPSLERAPLPHVEARTPVEHLRRDEEVYVACQRLPLDGHTLRVAQVVRDSREVGRAFGRT